MNKQREALEKALLALEIAPLDHNSVKSSFFEKRHYAIIALREALAEPEQKLDSALEALQNEMRETISKLDPNEMVWIHQPPGMPPILCKEPVVGAVPEGYNQFSFVYDANWNIPLHTALPSRKPLTDYQIREIDELVWKELSWEEKTFGQFALKMARAIERAHGIGSD